MQNSESEKTLDNLTQEANLPAKTSDVTFEPTTIVLAKVKGYPPWPAMILEESLLPEYISVKKPKKVKQPAKRKNSKPVEILPVRFFSDDTYIWIKNTDLKILSDETIQTYIEKHKTNKRKDNLLFEAYKLASTPPEMELFVEYGSKGKKPKKVEVSDEEVDLELEMDDELEEEEEEEEEEVEENVDEDFEESSRKRRKKSPSKSTKTKTASLKPKPKPKPKAKSKAKTKETETNPNEEGYDSDWGLDGLTYDYEYGNYIFEDEEEQNNFTSEFPSISEIQERFNKFQAQFNEINNKLSLHFLIDEEIKETEVLNILKKLKTLKDLPKSIILRSKLFKILILLVRKPIEAFPYKKIRTEIEGILRSWFNLSIESLTLEELNKINDELNNLSKSQTESQEPENKEGSVIEEIKKEVEIETSKISSELSSNAQPENEGRDFKVQDNEIVPEGSEPSNGSSIKLNGN